MKFPGFWAGISQLVVSNLEGSPNIENCQIGQSQNSIQQLLSHHALFNAKTLKPGLFEGSFPRPCMWHEDCVLRSRCNWRTNVLQPWEDPRTLLGLVIARGGAHITTFRLKRHLLPQGCYYGLLLLFLSTPFPHGTLCFAAAVQGWAKNLATTNYWARHLNK